MGALTQARRALAIDPENAAAARMGERLEEVLRYKGESTDAPVTIDAVDPTPTPPATEPEPPQAPPPPPKRRSLLDRLLRRDRA